MLTETTERALWFSPSGSRWYYDLQRSKQLNCGVNFRDVWTFHTERGQRFHPTQKPLSLMIRMAEIFVPQSGLIVDPFSGSGTTAVAAQKINRRFIAGDQSAEYVDIARKRLAEPYTLDFMTILEQQGVG